MRVAWLVDLEDAGLDRAVHALRGVVTASGWVDLGHPHSAADLSSADVVVVWADRPVAADLANALTDPSVAVVLAGPTIVAGDPEGAFAEAAGLGVGDRTPVHDIRVRAAAGAPIDLRPQSRGLGPSDHNGVHDEVRDGVLLVDKVLDDVQVLRVALVGLDEHPVLTWRPSTATAIWTLGSTPEAVSDRDATRMLVSLLSMMAGDVEAPSIGVGLLGYGAIGHEHSRAVSAVDGLHLASVCDTSDERLAAASHAAPGVATTTNAEALLERDDVDLVVVSTPPNSHSKWALRAIGAGKHVVVEKPFAIHTAEADEVLGAASAANRVVVVYQNRRFDPDHLAVRRLVSAGQLGELFHLETFVGGYGHPCNLWHSDEAVSGGAFYDWGSHVIDQILDLVPTPVDYVTATSHKRRWFDVTNADHSRVTIRFVDGVEAEFIHSDLAAALKPRWYLLGTQGALVGHWRRERVVARSDIGTLLEDVLAPADSPPVLDLHASDGSVTSVALVTQRPYAFHGELADRLRFGLPMTVTGEQSRRVLAVMEAARYSADDGGRPVAPR